jgi:hypothetical protein
MASNKTHSSVKRRVLRRAEKAFHDPEAKQRLTGEGIHVGEARTLSEAERLALLADADETRPAVTVTVYFSDTPVADRGEIEDPLSAYVEETGIGEWVGSGQGSIGDRAFFDVTFTVHNLAQALPLLQAKLRELRVGKSTELSATDGSVHGVY